MPALSLRLLGGFQAELGGRPLTEFYSNKVRALLAYVIVEAGRSHSRATLAALLWPDWADRAALGNLRFSLSKLRQIIGDLDAVAPCLLVTRDAVQYNPAADCRLDVLELEREIVASHWQAAARDGQPEEAVRGAIAHLEAAAGRYRGGFLEGLAVADSTEFEDWALLKREQLAREARAALGGLATLHRRLGDLAAAERHLRRLIGLDPWDEVANRQLLAVLAEDGRRNAALQHYAAFRQKLAEEMGVEPTAETTALYQSIRQRGEGQPVVAPAVAPIVRPAPATDPAATPAGSPPPPRPPFVARQAQLAQLERHLAQAMAGHGSVVFVTGEAGMGKTALLGELGRLALEQNPDLLAVGGQCSAHTGVGDPCLAFREVAQVLAGDLELRRPPRLAGAEATRRLQAARPAAVAALLQVAPEMVDRFVPSRALAGGVADSTPAAADLRARLEALTARRGGDGTPGEADVLGQYTGWLLSLSSSHPLLLLLDDLQWADDGSLNLVIHLGQRLAGARILVVGAYRPEDVALGRDGGRHPLLAVVNELRRLSGSSDVDLGQADGRELVSALVDGEANRLGDGFRQALYGRTGGHALFTVELLAGLREGGGLVQAADGAWEEAAGADWGRLPTRVEAVIAERIGRLPAAALAVLNVASVEGEEFTGEVVERVLGVSRPEAIRLLSDVLSKQHRLVRGGGMVRPEAAAQPLSRYRFRHQLFQEYVYGQLDPIERANLHQLVGEALEQLHGAQTAAIAGQLARHFELAAMPEKAIDYLLVVADHAAQLAAYREAVATLERGLELLRLLPEGRERAQRELRLRLALSAPLRMLYGFGDAARATASTVPASLRTGGGDEVVWALLVEASACRDAGDLERALLLGQQMMAGARDGGGRQALMLAHFVIGTTLAMGGELAQGRPGCEEALRLFDPDEDRRFAALLGCDLAVTLLGWLTIILWAQGYAAQAEDYCRQAVDRSRRLDQPASFAFAASVAVCLSILSGSGEGERRLLIAELSRLAAEKGLVALQPYTAVYQGWLQLEDGDTDEGLARMRATLERWCEQGAGLGAPIHLAVLAQASLLCERYEPGRWAVDQALRLVAMGVGRVFEAELYRLQALLQQAAGDRNAAEESLRRALALARARQARALELRSAIDRARLWRGTANAAEAYERLAGVVAQLDEAATSPDLTTARGLLAGG